jgi:CDP-2,3-bis-(O-geranylgeranyl)-sn-glycerol synthase
VQHPDPISCAVFLLLAFTLAGVAQTAWFASRWSCYVAIPVDGGRCWRGRRIFGENKTVRGFVAMVPAAAVAFLVLAALVPGSPASAGLWELSPMGYAALGALAGFGFMAGELPNSFVKRQLDVLPGASARDAGAAAMQFFVDRVDSGVGMLLAVSVAVPTSWRTWLLVLTIGPFIHWTFSVVFFRLGLKSRPA